MKKLISLIFCNILLFSLGLNGQTKIAVLDFPSMKGVSKKEAAYITGKLTAELSHAEGFSTIAKKEIDRTKLLKKKMTPEKYKELGQTVGADYIVLIEAFLIKEEYYENVNYLFFEGKVEATEFSDSSLVRTYIIDSKDGSVKYLVKDTIVKKQDISEIIPELSSRITSKIKANEDEVIILSDSLYIYPEDLGKFETLFAQDVCKLLNEKKMYGYDDWRIPTVEEMEQIAVRYQSVKGMQCVHYILPDDADVYDFCNHVVVNIRKKEGQGSYYKNIRTGLTDEGKKMGDRHYLRPVRGGVIPEN
ncbi:DUF1566 domain-containing protein [Bacteroidales bacterium OttesenSCG-928-C19]|nr:DUF1566 domain-containing protein [Bacteroidales bacterium OttesenSCG-928-C19]